MNGMDFSGESLEQLGQQARARIEAADKSMEKAENLYVSAGLYLIEAKRRVDAEAPQGGKTAAWVKYLTDHCQIGKTRAWEVMAIAKGDTTAQGLNARKNENRGPVVVWNFEVVMCDDKGGDEAFSRIRDKVKPKVDTDRVRLEAIVRKTAKLLTVAQLQA
ncbi:hypothetical protein NKH14_26780 [Mesorhizobium sp. M1380]|uniref:hypothetical protein n=1 Tax=Mesorhizobium sp. M1380 TaxID=2957093 RepID=UPI00333BEB7A